MASAELRTVDVLVVRCYDDFWVVANGKVGGFFMAEDFRAPALITAGWIPGLYEAIGLTVELRELDLAERLTGMTTLLGEGLYENEYDALVVLLGTEYDGLWAAATPYGDPEGVEQ